MTTDYRPIACDLHSQLELWAMHQESVAVTLQNLPIPLRGTVVDIVTRCGAEYLQLLAEDAIKHDIRLDEIQEIVPASGGPRWRQETVS